METLKQLKAIVENAPEGATHVSDSNVYFCFIDGVPHNFWVNGDEWVDCRIPTFTRELKDINKIIQLLEG